MDIRIRTTGTVGRITLTRPGALNALSHGMARAMEQALDAWSRDARLRMLVIDAEGDRAFCAGGDIAAIHRALERGDKDAVRAFWRDAIRMVAKLQDFPLPVATFLQGFTLGGGVGIGCHGSHRVVGDTSRVASPECTLGLVPEVGGTFLMALAPGRLGEYLGATGARMGAGDAIHAGFADYYIPEADWPALIARLEATGDWTEIDRAARPAPASALAAEAAAIDAAFAGETLRDCLNALRHQDTDFARGTLDILARNAPLSMAAVVEIIHRVRAHRDFRSALELEFRFAHRALERGDFAEGVRTRLVDRGTQPRWQHPAPDGPTLAEVAAALSPLDADELWEAG